jgi:AcrR family transcriptional regulator
MTMPPEKALKTRRGGRPNRQAQIVAVAEQLLRERGLAGVTTRVIAEKVPCSEGAIYVHFKDRLELILTVLEESLPEMLVPLRALKEAVGKGTPEENLVLALTGLMRFHERVTVMLCSLIGETELRERFRSSLLSGGRGPDKGIATLAGYIEAEKALGRVSAEVNSKVAAQTLMASSFFHVFTQELLGQGRRFDAKAVVRLLFRNGSEGTLRA